MYKKFTRRTAVKQAAVLIGSISLVGLASCSREEASNSNIPSAPGAANRNDPDLGNQTLPGQSGVAQNVSADSADSADPLIAEDHPAATALRYSHDASAVDSQLRVEKSGVAGENQYCDNCQFYQAVENSAYGRCQLIPVEGKHVAAKGWCISWIATA